MSKFVPCQILVSVGRGGGSPRFARRAARAREVVGCRDNSCWLADLRGPLARERLGAPRRAGRHRQPTRLLPRLGEGVPADEQEAALGAAGAALGGMPRSVALEIPGMQLACLDPARGGPVGVGLGPAHAVEADVFGAAAAGGARMVPQLGPSAAVDAVAPAMPGKPGLAFAVTGGLGGLGLLMADALAHQAASQVVLTGRSGRAGSSSSLRGLCEGWRGGVGGAEVAGGREGASGAAQGVQAQRPGRLGLGEGERMATKEFIIFLLFDAVRLLLLVTCGHVAGDRFTLSTGFGAF